MDKNQVRSSAKDDGSDEKNDESGELFSWQ